MPAGIRSPGHDSESDSESDRLTRSARRQPLANLIGPGAPLTAAAGAASQVIADSLTRTPSDSRELRMNSAVS